MTETPDGTKQPRVVWDDWGALEPVETEVTTQYTSVVTTSADDTVTICRSGGLRVVSFDWKDSE